MRTINGQIARSAAIALLATAFGIARIAECAAQPATTGNQPGIPAVETPTTLEAVLRNVKYALDRGLLLRGDFYRGENLFQYFGGSRTLRSSIASGFEGSVSGFGDMVEPLIVSGRSVPGMSFSFLHESTPDGITAVLDLDTPGKTTVYLNVIERIFGSAWRPAKRDNAEIVYSASDGAGSWHATLYFKANAELSLARISTKGKR